MTMSGADDSTPDFVMSAPVLPGGSIRIPRTGDLDELIALAERARHVTRPDSAIDAGILRSEVVGTGSWTRRQVIALDAEQRIRAWAVVHDRAAGRVGVALTVDPNLPAAQADSAASSLLQWVASIAPQAAQLDADVQAADETLQRWLSAAGYLHTRSWLHMSRPVDPGERFAPPRAGVNVRRVATHPGGMPIAEDLRIVHTTLEESFADHFNSYRESFPEFLQRLREDPGHRWDHWWLATVDIDGSPVPAGGLVSSVSPLDAAGVQGSYIDYIGVNRAARGRGVAKALLHSVIRDAAARGRNRIGLEVDADSPTGADGLYASLGWATEYITQSWHHRIH